MKKEIRAWVGLFTLLLLIGIGFVATIFWAQQAADRFECDKIRNLGYQVNFTDKLFSSNCEVKTKTGLWIDSSDFEIVAVEEFAGK